MGKFSQHTPSRKTKGARQPWQARALPGSQYPQPGTWRQSGAVVILERHEQWERCSQRLQ
uniref:Uncharacterized protein n=1 Tax=Spironucleus salmonicida TaxID=348837 RepID=V6LFP4_9EUKA|eukprot:EST42526.1 Hypothetical protein SS50377_17839 [Spironucleus salmonicida]